MEEIVWATIIIWFFLIAWSFASKSILFKGTSAIVGLILMIQLLSENFMLALAIMGISIYQMYVALFKED